MKKKADKFVLNSEPHNPAKALLLPKEKLKSGFSMKRSYGRVAVKREALPKQQTMQLIDERNIKLRLRHKE